MIHKIKNKLRTAPVLGYGLRIANNVAHLPRANEQQRINNDILITDLHTKQTELNNLREDYVNLQEKFNQLQFREDTFQAQLTLIEKNIRLKKSKPSTKKAPSSSQDTDLFADDHLLDIFYTKFEDRFRGTEEMITERLKEYLPDFTTKTKLNFKKTPVLDIGCGRGEFLQLLKDNKVYAEGLDINIDMVERANKKGLVARQHDALDFLEEQKPQSYGAITGFHIVEHIPFPALLRLFTSAYKVLVPDGFVVFETPNPENIVVGSCAFYMDPSHLNPIPPDLLAFALETCGFRKIEIRRMHAVDSHDRTDGLPSEITNRFYGPRDYAVVAFKQSF